jgi:precorrin-3B C17-methyltransferase
MSEDPIRRFAVTPGVGQVFFTPEQLAAVAEAAGPGGRIEMNTFQQLIVHTASPTAEERVKACGLAVYRVGHVVKNLRTCTFCVGDYTDGLPAAQELDRAVAGAEIPYTLKIGYSGCNQNCGEATLQEIGIVRVDDRINPSPETYDIYVGGRTGTLTPRAGSRVGAGVARADLVGTVQALLQVYRSQARRRERFASLVGRIGPAPFAEAVPEYARVEEA